MSIYQKIHDEHEEMIRLMKEIEALGAETSPQRDELFNTLKKLLIIHAEAEERAFYKPLEKSKATDEKVEHGEEEHEDIEDLLEGLTNGSLAGTAWLNKFEKLKHDVEHHIREEENDIFPKARQVITPAESEKIEKEFKKEEDKLEKKMNISER